MMLNLRLWLAKKMLPATHRLIEVGDEVSAPTARSDLIRGGDALSRVWGCDPAILYNGAHHLLQEEV